MKKNIFISLIVINASIVSCDGQVLFEKCFEPDFDSGLNSVVNDSSGNFYAVGGGSFGFTRPGWFIKTNSNGDLSFQIPLMERDDNYLLDIIPTLDNNYLICGYNSYCDVGPQNQGIIYKMSPLGNVVWSHPVNPDTTWNPFDNKLHQVFEMRNGKIILRADSTLYLTDENGVLQWKKAFTGTLLAIGEDFSHHVIATIDSLILLLDSSGLQVNQFSFPSQVYHLKMLEDSTYVIACGGSLMKLDSSFAVITQVDLTQISFSSNHLAIDQGKIWISNSTGSDFAGFDFNLQLTDSFRTQFSTVIVNSISVLDSVIVVAGKELNRKNYHYLKSYGTNGSHAYHDVDLELSGISFDTTYGYHYDWHPVGVNSIAFVANLMVTNAGTDTIHSFNINAQSNIVYGPCGYFEYIKRVANINLLPGQSMNVSLDMLEESGVVYSPPFTYTFCAWISCPDSMVDKNHSNDYLCDSFVVTEIVGIETVMEKDPVLIYPNPTSSAFTVKLSDVTGIIMIEIFNIIGEKIYSSSFHPNIETIDANLEPGVYFIQLSDTEKFFIQKLVVE